MNNHFSFAGAAGGQSAAGQDEVLRCGTLVLTGFPAPVPKGTAERPAQAPENPARASAEPSRAPAAGA